VPGRAERVPLVADSDIAQRFAENLAHQISESPGAMDIPPDLLEGMAEVVD
jgi:hypothetical protein